jgi:uncharacterized protein DUF11
MRRTETRKLVLRRFRTTTKRLMLVSVAVAALAAAPGPRAAGLVDANLAVSLTAAPDAPVVGQAVSYTATLTDKGPDRATGVALTIVSSGSKAAMSAVSASQAARCTIDSGARSARCALDAPLEVGGSAQMAVTVATSAPGTLTVTARSRSRQYDPIKADNLSQMKTHVAERDAPVPEPLYSTEFSRPFAPDPAFSIRWRASDAGSGVDSYDVRYRAAPATGGFGPYRSWLTATAERTARFTGRYGSTYCFSFRATDADRNASAWTDDRCVSVGLRPVVLRRTAGWTLSGTEGGLRTRRTGASLALDGVVARRLVLSALVGPTYGQIGVTWNGRLLRTINLRAAARSKKLFTLADFGRLSRGRLVLTARSTDKTVAVSGLGVLKQ